MAKDEWKHPPVAAPRIEDWGKPGYREAALARSDHVIEVIQSMVDEAKGSGKRRVDLEGLLELLQKAREEYEAMPSWIVPAIITPIEKVPDGAVIELIKPAWQALLAELERDPSLRFQLDWRKVEEIVAAGYEAAGCRVILTPRSGDGGRDVIAEIGGFAKVQILNSVKALGEGKTVPRANVDELLGVLSRSNAAQGVLTTTATFAPGIAEIPELQRQIAGGRLLLVDGAQLVPRLLKMSSGKPFSDDE